MRPIAEVANQELNWVADNRIRWVYELRAGDELVGTLRWRNWRTDLADGETQDHRWVFSGQEGALSSQATARIPDSDMDAAIYRSNWLGRGTAQLADGRIFPSPGRFGEPGRVQMARLVHFRMRGLLAMYRLPTRVKIAAEAGRSDLPLLVLLGWYVIVLEDKHGPQFPGALPGGY